MTITSIEPCVKTRNRSNVFIDGTFAFSVYNDIILEAKLKSNTDVDEKFVAKVKAYDEYKRAVKKALEYISFKDRTEKEVREKLVDFRPVITNKVMAYVNKKGYINDDEYAVEYTKHLVNKGYGQSKIRQKLFDKGIKNDVIENVLSTIVVEDVQNKAMELGQKVWRKYSDDPGKASRKVVENLVRHGYSYDIALGVLKSMEENDDN